MAGRYETGHRDVRTEVLKDCESLKLQANMNTDTFFFFFLGRDSAFSF